MAPYYLAINYGAYEGWRLHECDSAEEALGIIKTGEIYGTEWKILKEIEVKTHEVE